MLSFSFFNQFIRKKNGFYNNDINCFLKFTAASTALTLTSILIVYILVNKVTCKWPYLYIYT